MKRLNAVESYALGLGAAFRWRVYLRLREIGDRTAAEWFIQHPIDDAVSPMLDPYSDGMTLGQSRPLMEYFS